MEAFSTVSISYCMNFNLLSPNYEVERDVQSGNGLLGTQNTWSTVLRTRVLEYYVVLRTVRVMRLMLIAPVHLIAMIASLLGPYCRVDTSKERNSTLYRII